MTTYIDSIKVDRYVVLLKYRRICRPVLSPYIMSSLHWILSRKINTAYINQNKNLKIIFKYYSTQSFFWRIKIENFTLILNCNLRKVRMKKKKLLQFSKYMYSLIQKFISHEKINRIFFSYVSIICFCNSLWTI